MKNFLCSLLLIAVWRPVMADSLPIYEAKRIPDDLGAESEIDTFGQNPGYSLGMPPDETLGETGTVEYLGWMCVSEISAESSSNLASQGKFTYSPKNAVDKDISTSWVEGKPGYGIGEWIKVIIPPTSKNVESLFIKRVAFGNGLMKSDALWQANARPKSLKVYIQDKPFAVFTLQDVYQFQKVEFPPVNFDPKKGTSIKFEIVDVYKGQMHEDTVISEVNIVGGGCP